MPNRLRRIADLRPGDHVCLLYQSEEEYRDVLVPFLRHGLERGEKVLYIAYSHRAEAILGYLGADDFDVQPYVERGQLRIAGLADAYLRGGVFDPDQMMALWRSETERALAEGYTALRATGECNWAWHGLPGSERWIEYEARLNEIFNETRCLALCQYDQRHLPAAILLDVLSTHPICIVGTELYENFYFIPPEDLLGGDLPAVTLRRRLDNLARHKAVEEELRRQKDQAQRYLDVAGVAMVALDRHGNVGLINKKGCDLLGYKEREILGQNWFENFMPDGCSGGVEAKFRRLMSGDLTNVEYVENPVLARTGEERVIAWHNTFLQDEDGSITGTLSSGEDITERKRAEEALRASEARYRAVVQDQTEFVSRFTSGDWTLTFVNKACSRAFGKRPEEMIGRSLMPFVAPEDRERLVEFLRSLGPDNPVGTVENCISLPGGEIRWTEWTNRAICDEQGKVVEFQSVGRDITERKRAEEQLSNYRYHLEELVQERTTELQISNRQLLRGRRAPAGRGCGQEDQCGTGAAQQYEG
jgi:PAS domain S-box-containing protein